MIDLVPKSGMIKLGKQGENRAIRVILPNIRAGSGSILLLHQRALDKKPYPVPVAETAEGIIWVVSSTDTANQGRGQAELQWLGENGEVVKSVTYQTETSRSLSAPGAVPDEPMKPYVQAVAKDAQAAKDAAANATEAARIAEASAGQAGAAASSAADSLKRLEDGIASGNFRGEKGDKGDPGPKGPQGEVGPAGDTTAADAAAEAAKKAAQEAQKAAEAAVLYTEQHITGSQQEQARSNINAADKARQNILVGSETGNPIAVDDAFSAPLCGLTIYGKSTQDGTPSPDNPVPIVSVGDGGSVTVKATGKNLIQGINRLFAPSEAIEGGVRIVNNTGGNSRLAFFNADLKKGITYTISFAQKVVQGDGLIAHVYLPDIEQYISDKFTPTQDTGRIAIYLRYEQYGTIEITNIQLEIGTASTAYSPYHEQLLTLLTPNGLPGIPVTSGGNYTDSTGQQWVCDEVDLERGVMVQRVDKAALNDTKTLAEQNDAILTTPIETTLTPAEITAYKVLTTYEPDTVVQVSDGAGVKLDYQRDVNIAIKKLEDAVASMTAT